MRFTSRPSVSRYGSQPIGFVFVLSVAWMQSGRLSGSEMPKNVAVGAQVAASSQFSDAFGPQMAVSGVIPSKFEPDSSDWAVRGTQNAWFELRWDQPVEAAQVVYYARQTSPLLECFKDYAVYVNEDPEPVVRGTLEQRRGPQFIGFPKQQAMKIRIEFLSCIPTRPIRARQRSRFIRHR